MQKISFTLNLCIELTDKIVSHVDDPEDLLNLACTCKALHKIIVPDHLELRHIRCDPRQHDLWNKLSERRTLAANVRFLELRSICVVGHWSGCLSRDILPRSMELGHIEYTLSDKGVDLTPLAGALGHMDTLLRFSWTGNMPAGIGHDVWMALDNVASPLKQLQMSLSTTHTLGGAGILSRVLPVKRLSSLTGLALVYVSPNDMASHPLYDAVATQAGLLLQDVLIDLDSLGFHTDTSNARLADFFKTAHLYQLRRFTVRAKMVKIKRERQELPRFLSRHPKLEALWLDLAELPNIKEHNVTLPSLKAFHFPCRPSASRKLLETIPHAILKGLKHLCIPLDAEACSLVLNQTPLLESCYLHTLTDISQLHTNFPSLQRLDFRFRPLEAREREKIPKDCVKEWLNDISNLTRLTHLAGFFAEMDVSFRDPSVLKLVQDLANTLRNLKYVEVYDHGNHWITIDRDPDGNYSTYELAIFQQQSKFTQWGNFFLGYE